MDFDEINRILEMVREHELSEFELEREGFKIRIKKGGMVVDAAPASSGLTGPAPDTVPAPPAVTLGEADLAVVKSPIVGTFFRASEAAAPPFVEVGSSVRKGQILCIIEAMKLMNEIDSEYDGEVVKIYVENGQPVQFGDRLFAIKARGDV